MRQTDTERDRKFQFTTPFLNSFIYTSLTLLGSHKETVGVLKSAVESSDAIYLAKPHLLHILTIV